MISWIQRSFQHHFRAIFGVLLVVTIISFIFTIGASPGIGRAGPKAYSQFFFGHDLSRQGVSDQISGDAALSVQLQAGFAALYNIDSTQLQEYAMERTAAIGLADQIKLPTPTREDLKSHIQGLRAFAGEDGQFDASRYTAFRDSIKSNPRVTESDIARVMGDDVRASHLRHLLVGPGYVLPTEVRSQLVRTDSTWTLDIASVDFAAFKPEIPVAEDALVRFFDANGFRYAVPPSVGVDCVGFPASAYLSQVTIAPAEVRAFYDENPARFPKAADKKAEAAKPANADADFAAVQSQVEAALKNQKALRLAAKAAADFTVVLFEQKLKPGTAALSDFLAKAKVTVKPIAPFHRDSVPADLGWPAAVSDQALQLSPEHPISDALSTPTGSVVLFWREALPTYQPKLAQVRDRVVADFKEDARINRFVELSRSFRSQIETRVKAGDSFDKAAAAAGEAAGFKVAVKAYPAFLRRQAPKDIEPAVLNTLERLESGGISEMIRSGDQGLVVRARERKIPDLSEANPQFAATRAQLGQLESSLNEGAVLGEIVARELKKSAPAAAN